MDARRWTAPQRDPARLPAMIDRADALAALAEDEFDVVVVGGGITGAGVALDAATRGYSVALVERADYAAGTSSRSSKLVHGGLRYLQNFDLGLVREALLERQLMVALAPHLVHPLPLVVAAFDGASPSRKIGVGLNLYDVMSVERRGRSRGRGRRGRARLGRSSTSDFAEWSPERHRVISGEEVLELIPALAAREPTSGYLFYDCQTDDVRLVLTVLGEAERFGAVCANGCNVTELVRDSGGRAAGVRVRDDGGEEFVVRASNVVNATGVWADRLRPGELHDDADVPRIRPSRGTHITLRHEDLPLVGGGAIVPAGGGRSIFALPWLGRTLLGTTDNDYEGDLDGSHHVPPSEEDVAYLLDATNEYFGTALVRGRPHRRVRGRAAAHLLRRPEEVRRHLAQGRALRDVERDGDDHRRQADDVAADGEDDRRPARRARGARRAVPHARDPARRGGGQRRPAARRGRAGGVLRGAGGALRPCRARRAGRRARAR